MRIWFISKTIELYRFGNVVFFDVIHVTYNDYHFQLNDPPTHLLVDHSGCNGFDWCNGYNKPIKRHLAYLLYTSKKFNIFKHLLNADTLRKMVFLHIH